MLFFPFTTATAALLSLRSTVASPLDGINESITALFTSTFCFQTVGNGSAAALYNLGNGKESYCTCLSIANTNSSGYSVCPGGEKAACRSTETSSSTGTTITNTCTTCPTGFCQNLESTDLKFGSACNSGSVIYVVSNSFCNCGTLANLAITDPTRYKVCHAPTNVYTSCSAPEADDGLGNNNVNANCTSTCLPAHRSGVNGSTCVLRPSSLPLVKRRETEENGKHAQRERMF